MISTAVVSGFILALAAPLLHRVMPRWSSGILALLPLGLFVFFLGYLDEIAAGGTLVEIQRWVPGLETSFSFYLDGVSLTFALLICGIGACIVFYSGGYLAGQPQLGRFQLYMLGFMASMLGTVLAGNVISLFIFWELTSICSYFLIGFDHHRESARSAALQALLVTGIGGLALLAGLLLLASVAGSPELWQILEEGDAVRSHALYVPILFLVLAGAFTKSAQFPFHFWLPSAMEGPAPVSAYLHSATMVKAGVYLLLRLNPVMGDTATWQWCLTGNGALTMLIGAWLALTQHDMKLILAYSTVNGLGTLVFLTGLQTPPAAQAAVVFLVGHALYKASLFLAAGVVDHETGSRDVRRLRGLRRQLPLITAAAVLAGLSMAGLPPLLGFVGKELVLEAGLDATIGGRLPMGAVLVSGALLLAATGRLIVRPFFGHAPECGDTSGHRPGIDLLLGPLLPSLAGLLFGLYPGLLGRKLLAPAAAAVLSRPVEMHLALWHGFNFILFLSAIVILAGCGFYAAFPRLEPTLDRWRRLGAFGPAAGYEVCLKALKRLAAWQTRLLQGGYLHNYILVIVLTAVGLTLLALGRYGALAFSPGPFEVRLFEAVIAALMIAAAVVAVRSESRLGAIVAMGVIGYGLALIFVDFGAPDLAMTQFIIETMTVILFVLVIYRLPPYRHISTRGQKTVNAAVGIVSGLLMATLVLVALDVQQGSRLSHFFAENSLLLAHGRNVVNVIIVDFRGLDTLGEITVLSLAGIGVYTLLKLRPHP